MVDRRGGRVSGRGGDQRFIGAAAAHGPAAVDPDGRSDVVRAQNVRYRPAVSESGGR